MTYRFSDRHNGPSNAQINQMLKCIGVDSLEALIKESVPSDILLKTPLKLEEPLSEYEYLKRLKSIAAKNSNSRSFIGLGYYGTATLPVVIRNMFENPSWYTSYTPYQAEISQGRLEALLNFQTMISSLTGLKIANSSMLDDATSAAEAMRMMFELRSRDAVKAGKKTLFLDNNIFPQISAVVKTRAAALGIQVDTGDFKTYEFKDNCFGAIVQYPAANGAICNYTDFAEKAHKQEVLVTAVVDLMALALIQAPGEWGADIAVGTAQRFGLPMGFGGPTAGFLATKDDYKRFMPGRIIGISLDRRGKPALRMALQTREQHIKREKATSNICTATALMANMSGMFAVYHGPEGIKSIAEDIASKTRFVALKLQKSGYKLSSEQFFDTIEVFTHSSEDIKKRALAKGYNLYFPSSDKVRFSLDEITTITEISDLLNIFGALDSKSTIAHEAIYQEVGSFHKYSENSRKSEYLTESVFNKYHSETELMRYIKKLERRDISLTHSMIPLGSCTMKLNAAAELMPLSWSELTNIHPFTPTDQAEGYMQLINEVERDLAIITGFDSCSLQPNSGAAGEYAGLLTIKAYFESKGGDNRNVALIPTSAHGTNPASAALAGMEIVLVSCDENGNIKVEELEEKAKQYADRLACLMITYPSTHGVFEVKIREIIDIVHSQGGLVYMDGANMNAQVGITNPGFIGADVCHLNLHKTFAMPHGGGGPGVGPICVTKELAPFLPCHPFKKDCHQSNSNSVSSAPYGSPLMLPVTHAYIKMLGEEGMRKATEMAILNANYIASSIKNDYNTLYTGENGRVAHECILDLRHFKKEYGVDATDVAKRLMDFGFHAPTLSFPVVETLMVEPTESESKDELDRFIEAMRAIKQECEAIKLGKLDPADNQLKNAPHTAEEVSADVWNHQYSREVAAYPLEWIKENKFWPHVTRVDNGYGDRNLMCSCEGWL